MREALDEELRILRARAYGPGADIHADPLALDRLQQLEGAGRESTSVLDADKPELGLDPLPVESPEVIQPDVDHRELQRARLASLMGSVVAYLGSVRRSTWLIVAGILVVASILATALTIVQRVQTDPLQTGATQVARLSVDPGFEIPDVFGVPAGSEQLGQAFQDLHGLRTVVNPTGFSGFESTDDCIVIYAPLERGGFSGLFFSGCAAEEFPAMAQFRSNVDGFPAELREAFPDSTGLQFVYDRENNEVVVFASRGK
ncbi:hypothetical protein IWX81_000974 [Salinibacterium sp. CAN_S4]|uniref:hypothetical protein n=1 Tax=Salinibacterium sp. CAN_S4 TaxID=2787727 RepID=UPI0018EFA876